MNHKRRNYLRSIRIIVILPFSCAISIYALSNDKVEFALLDNQIQSESLDLSRLACSIITFFAQSKNFEV